MFCQAFISCVTDFSVRFDHFCNLAAYNIDSIFEIWRMVENPCVGVALILSTKKMEKLLTIGLIFHYSGSVVIPFEFWRENDHKIIPVDIALTSDRLHS